MTDQIDTITIKNFRIVNDWFYRGGQPLNQEFKQLKNLGVKTVICLRWNKNIIKEELELGQSLNLNVISIPLTYWKLPNKEEIKKYFDIINNTNMRPVYLHCKHGSDRTGMLAAFYRMKMEGWTADQAYDEMRNSGFHKIRMHHFKYAIYSFRKKLEQGTL